MEQHNLLGRIRSQLQKLEALTDSIASQPDAIYRMDIEYLKQNAIQLYDLLHQLRPFDAASAPVEGKADEPKILEAEVMQAAAPEVELFVEDTIQPTPLQTEEQEEDDAELPLAGGEIAGPEIPEADTELIEDVEEEEQEEIPVLKTPQASMHATTLDLFEENIPERLGERFGRTDDRSIVAHMQQRQIHDLRAAIGINEKFLFINELFGGNLNQYNKTIDELNNLVSHDGARAYLIELRIQHQWPAHAPAVEKLSELIERKFRNL